MAHAHHHHHDDVSGTRLVITMLLNFGITLVELVGGLLAGSLSLISDALHNFSDGIAIIVSYVALRLAQRPSSDSYTFGLKRAQILAAIINAGVLLAISAYLVREAVVKLAHPEAVDGRLMLIVASFGLAANLVGTYLLHRGAKSNINIRSAYLHLLSDAVSSVAVILGALTISLWNIHWLDPLLSLAIALWVGWESWKIVQQALGVLMLKVPSSIDLEHLRADLNQVEGICNPHHIHIWQLDDASIHFEAHVGTDRETLRETEPIAESIEKMLRERYGITHVTLQFEGGVCLTGQTTAKDHHHH